ncbi:MAG: urease accessory protein UreD [Akkermansiaceae bacterium]
MNGSIQSQVHLQFTYDESRNRTILAKRQAGGLCSISKPYWNDGVLGLQLVNPTAGLFSGDSLGMMVEISDHAQVALTSPSATRYHTMPEGRAHITQEFCLGRNAWLDFWPEIIIPQKDSDVVQTTVIHLEENATMVFFDSLAPGRIAHGENYTFRRLETRLEIHQSGSLIAKERCVLSPSSGRWPLEVPDWESCYYGAIWIAGKDTEKVITNLQNGVNLAENNSHHGASLLSPELGVIRIISPSSLLLKKATLHFREIIQAHLPLLKMSFRKL